MPQYLGRQLAIISLSDETNRTNDLASVIHHQFGVGNAPVFKNFKAIAGFDRVQAEVVANVLGHEMRGAIRLRNKTQSDDCDILIVGVDSHGANAGMGHVRYFHGNGGGGCCPLSEAWGDQRRVPA